MYTKIQKSDNFIVRDIKSTRLSHKRHVSYPRWFRSNKCIVSLFIMSSISIISSGLCIGAYYVLIDALNNVASWSITGTQGYTDEENFFFLIFGGAFFYGALCFLIALSFFDGECFVYTPITGCWIIPIHRLTCLLVMCLGAVFTFLSGYRLYGFALMMFVIAIIIPFIAAEFIRNYYNKYEESKTEYFKYYCEVILGEDQKFDYILSNFIRHFCKDQYLCHDIEGLIYEYTPKYLIDN